MKNLIISLTLVSSIFITTDSVLISNAPYQSSIHTASIDETPDNYDKEFLPNDRDGELLSNDRDGELL